MYEIVSEIVKRGQAEELIKIIKQYEISKRKEKEKNERF